MPKLNAKDKAKARGEAKVKGPQAPIEVARGLRIGPPYRITHRSIPPERAQAYILGTVNGERKKIVTNINVNMSKDYSPIMVAMLEEAKAGKYKNKGQAIDRRDELLRLASCWPKRLWSSPHGHFTV